MMKLLYYTLVLYLMASISVDKIFAQTEFRFDRISTDEGLSSNTVYGIFQDSKGFIWFITSEGLDRFDGIRYKRYPNHLFDFKKLNSAYEDSKGYLWFTFAFQEPKEKSGLVRFNPETETFENFHYKKDSPSSLSNDHITFVKETIFDGDTSLWIGTFNGLNKFLYGTDSFERYLHAPGKVVSSVTWWPQCLESCTITDLAQDSQGNLWIGTGYSLKLFQRKHNIFQTYINDPADPNSLSGNIITGLLISQWNGGEELWITTPGKGVNKVSLDTSQDYSRNVKVFRYLGPESRFWDNGRQIQNIHESVKGDIWLGSNLGLTRLEASKRDHNVSFEHCLNESPYSLLSIENILSLKNGDILASGGIMSYSERGLHHFNQTSKQLKNYQIQDQYADLPGATVIFDMLLDHTGTVWIATFNKGVFKFDSHAKHFSTFSFDESKDLGSNHVNAIIKDKNHNLWLGTRKGLKKIEASSGKLTTYGIKTGLLGDNIASIAEDEQGYLWIGFWNQQLARFNPATLEIKYFQNIRDENGFPGWSIVKILITKQGKLYFGSLGHGLLSLDPTTQEYEQFLPEVGNSNSLSDSEVWSILEDKDGILWIGTEREGLCSYDPLHNTWNRYSFNQNNPFSIGGNDIKCVIEDHRGYLWMGGVGSGLNRLDKESKKFKVYRKKDGINSNDVFGIVEDELGYLWLSTSLGLSRFDPENETFKNYTQREINNKEFNACAHFKDSDNQLYFGGTNGFTYFNPDSILDNPVIPKVAITDLFINNVPTKQGDTLKSKLVITKDISFLDGLELHYTENYIKFNFSALHYANPSKNFFRYKLTPYDLDWQETDQSNASATYNKLSPGNYTLTLEGSNNDGVWSDPLSFHLHIKPPFWETYAFKIILISLLIISVLGIYNLRVYSLKKRKSALEKEVKARTYEIVIKNKFIEEQNNNITQQNEALAYANSELAEKTDKLLEMDQLKTRFFMNISHELRTPLTLILGPIDQAYQSLSENSQEELERQLEIIRENANRLHRLIDQMLDIHALETGDVQIQAAQYDLIPFLRGVINNFSELAKENRINYQFLPESESLEVYFDRDKMEKIIFNFLSNAFKFTSAEGSITIETKYVDTQLIIDEIKSYQQQSALELKGNTYINNSSLEDIYAEGYAAISVSDSGSGIPKENLPYIFERFYQVHEKGLKGEIGSGIGLAYVQTLINAHHGKIKVESQQEIGTTFTFWIPIGKSHFYENELLSSDREASPVLLPVQSSVNNQQADDIPELVPLEQDISQGSVLIVEDNQQVRRYIRDEIQSLYHVYEANNGKTGFEMALEHTPDLIVSDIMMPDMDGFALCKAIREDMRISHIPIVLLTARSSDESHLQGLDEGADAFITKPFKMNILKAQISKLIQLRRKLKDSFSTTIKLGPEEVFVNSPDKDFVKRAIAIVNDHIDDPEFNVDKFSRILGMSRTHLYRKIVALTDYSAFEFIRVIRLKKAGRMLKKGDLSVKEVAYSVGFSNMSHFSKAFKQFHGVPPRDFKR